MGALIAMHPLVFGWMFAAIGFITGAMWTACLRDDSLDMDIIAKNLRENAKNAARKS